jgi:hypothetical protein
MIPREGDDDGVATLPKRVTAAPNRSLAEQGGRQLRGVAGDTLAERVAMMTVRREEPGGRLAVTAGRFFAGSARQPKAGRTLSNTPGRNGIARH